MGERPVSSWDAQGLVWPTPSPLPQVSIQKKCFQNGPCANFPGTTLDSIILTGVLPVPWGIPGFLGGFLFFFFCSYNLWLHTIGYFRDSVLQPLMLFL